MMIHNLVKVRGADFCDDQFPIISTIGRGPKGQDAPVPMKFADPIEWDINSAYDSFTYIDDFCDDEVYVFSTMGQGPKGEQGEKGDASTDEQTYDAVSRFIEDNPEYVTTVEDGAITTPKIANGAVTAPKLASDAIPTMSRSIKGIAKVGAGLAMNNGAVELDGSGDIATAVASWLDAHPEATTTVEDGSVSYEKLASDLREVIVKKNLLPVDGNGVVQVYGLSTTYEDGVLRAIGTATQAGGRLNRIAGPFTLPAGTYTLSRSLDQSTNLSIILQNATDNTVLANAFNYYPATFTIDSDTSVYIGINVASGLSYDVEVNVQLESGSTATSFVLPSLINATDEVARTLASDYYDTSVHSMPSNGGITDANDAEINRIYLLIDVSNIANLPTNQSGTLITLSRHPLAIVQLYCDVNRILYYRGNWGDLGWSSWKRLVTPQDIPEMSEPCIMTAYNNITCCGDSLTWGQVYTSATESRRAYVPYPAALNKITGAAVSQHAVPGYTAAQWWNAFSSQIQTKTNQLAIIFLGTNSGLTDTLSTDAPSESSPSTWNTSTNTGAYARIVNDFISANAKVLLLRCYVTTGDLNVTNSVIDQIGERFGCAVIDAPNLTNDKYHYWPNGSGRNSVHYNDFGYNAFASALVNRVSALNDNSMKLIMPN